MESLIYFFQIPCVSFYLIVEYWNETKLNYCNLIYFLFRIIFIISTHKTVPAIQNFYGLVFEKNFQIEIGCIMSEKYNLLIVEDDALSLKFYRLYLSRFFNLSLVETVDEFYAAINSEIKFDVVLMDISLRDEKDGLQLTSELRASEKYKNCPILALTANIFVQDEIAAYKAGITKFLRKPIDNHVLLHELHGAVIESLK